MLMTDQVATAPCTDPIQESSPILKAKLKRMLFRAFSARPLNALPGPMAQAFIFRAVGAPIRFAPLALRSISRRWRCDPFRAVDAAIHFAPLTLRSISSGWLSFVAKAESPQRKGRSG